jgi:MFS family permease
MLISRSFTELMLYRVCLTLSYQILAVTVGWHIYDLTRNPLALGLVGLAEVVPYFCAALFAGHAVDVMSKKKIAILGCAIHALIAALMVAVTLGAFAGSGLDAPTMIYVGIGLAGVARAFLRPTYQVLFAQALERKDFARGAAVGTVVFQMAQVTGPALGGGLIAWPGLTYAYFASGFFALAGVGAVMLLRYRPEPVREAGASVWTSIVEGLRFVMSRQIILAVLALDMFAVLFGGAVSMLPAFVDEILGGNPETLGLLRAAPAAGTALMGLWLARHPVNRDAGRYLLGAVAGFGVSIIAFGLSGSFWSAALWLALSGACDGVSVVIRSTILQLTTPDQMRGRVSAINGLFIGSSNEIGALESGFAASVMGLAPSIVFGGVMTLAVVACCRRMAPVLRDLHLNQLHP